MSGNVDAGDAIELTFNTAPGATVTVTWIDPDQVVVLDGVPVGEQPAGSGQFPKTFLPTAPGLWEAVFTATGAATAVETFYVRAVDITGPAPLATVGEVADQFGDMTPAQESLTKSLIRAASKIVRQRFPKIDAHISAGKLDPEVVALGVVAMVLRVLRNPGGLRAETVGPFSRTYDTTAAAGLLVITDDETSMLSPSTVANAAGRVGTIMAVPGLAPHRGAHGWW